MARWILRSFARGWPGRPQKGGWAQVRPTPPRASAATSRSCRGLWRRRRCSSSRKLLPPPPPPPPPPPHPAGQAAAGSGVFPIEVERLVARLQEERREQQPLQRALREGWVEQWDEEHGALSYYNADTQQFSWEWPSAAEEALLAEGQFGRKKPCLHRRPRPHSQHPVRHSTTASTAYDTWPHHRGLCVKLSISIEGSLH
jgi:hypothetical protein